MDQAKEDEGMESPDLPVEPGHVMKREKYEQMLAEQKK